MYNVAGENSMLASTFFELANCEQKYTISIANKLNRGFYFARINAGTESVIKRISIY